MLRSINSSNRGQIGETVTWIFATLIIIVILTISILSTKFIINADKKITFAEDKEKDLIATKSINAFLKNEENADLLKNKDYDSFELEVQKLLDILPQPSLGSAGGWNFQLYENEEKKIEIYNYRIAAIGAVIGQYNHFEENILLEQTKLRFWLECQGICK